MRLGARSGGSVQRSNLLVLKQKEQALKSRPLFLLFNLIIYRVFPVYENIIEPSRAAFREIFTVLPEHARFVKIVVVNARFDIARVSGDIVKVLFDIPLAEDKADIAYVLKILRLKILAPIERDIAALNDEVLAIFDSRFHDFARDGPEMLRQLFIGRGGRERAYSRSDEPHLEVVEREIGIFIFLKQSLSERRLAGVGVAPDEDNHR